MLPKHFTWLLRTHCYRSLLTKGISFIWSLVHRSWVSANWIGFRMTSTQNRFSAVNQQSSHSTLTDFFLEYIQYLVARICSVSQVWVNFILLLLDRIFLFFTLCNSIAPLSFFALPENPWYRLLRQIVVVSNSTLLHNNRFQLHYLFFRYSANTLHS